EQHEALTETQHAPSGRRRRSLHTHAIEERAVAAAEVFDRPSLALAADGDVLARDAVVGQREPLVHLAADDERAPAESSNLERRPTSGENRDEPGLGRSFADLDPLGFVLD